jgi:hypothetical protein
MVYSSRKVYNACLKKKFVIDTEGSPDHKQLVYIIDSHRLACTKISHGPDHDLSESRIADMARQCGLRKTQFVKFINCTLSAEEYHQIQLARLADRLKQQSGGKTKHTKK